MKYLLIGIVILFCWNSATAQYQRVEPKIEFYSWDTTWNASDTLYKVEVHRIYDQMSELGIISLFLTRRERNDSVILWTYEDSLLCDWQDVVVYLDFNKALIQAVDSNQQYEIALVYTLDCTTDISPISRYLIYYNLSTKDTIVVKGWTLDPATPILVSEDNLLFNPENVNDIYNPALTPGRIQYNADLDRLSDSMKSKIYRIWMKANELDKNGG
ncbi:MAG: hypothetical protein H6608_01015 [Flavobacteriales bacterium]|nr:hypothetical protein [Bacteroidota bacterium]MCB9239687.1 hypothetical protein [Flavobacteriales bacterium]